MKYKDINQKFTDIVNEYLQKGFLFNTATMSGSQGETAKVDLTDGETIVCIVLNASKYTDSSLYVGICKDAVTPHVDDSWNTIWLHHLEIVMEEKFYYVANDYYVRKEEYIAIGEKRKHRYQQKHVHEAQYITGENVFALARRIIQTQFGYKKVSDDEIQVIKSLYEGKNVYTVSYRKYSYRLR